MELPDLGKHCSEVTCKQLDFLPLTCDACEELFCKDHITYDRHKCSSAYKKNVQVPVCPLCDAPVPIKRGELPDIAVERHIARNCSYELSVHKQKIFSNRCCKEGCRKKELMKIECVQCQSNFCLSHRHPLDHDCKSKGPLLSKAGYAALMRSQKTSEQNKPAVNPPMKPQKTDQSGCSKAQDKIDPLVASGGPVISAFDLHNGLSEAEALQRALELSLLEAGINNLLTLRNPNISTMKTTGQ
ncbi:AN1-type zinc finger protein 2A [Pseudophryne corroboree]|uniref:AN1-type zinc finger protein 2A n=1 Tax=Pseudophryne corroboree TaxID=495146 RepID=UPI003081BC8E